jgi:hypothetical protein
VLVDGHPVIAVAGERKPGRDLIPNRLTLVRRPALSPPGLRAPFGLVGRAKNAGQALAYRAEVDPAGARLVCSEKRLRSVVV